MRQCYFFVGAVYRSAQSLVATTSDGMQAAIVSRNVKNAVVSPASPLAVADAACLFGSVVFRAHSQSLGYFAGRFTDKQAAGL